VLETWALLRRGPGGTKACARAAEPKSRALETHASGLNGWHHGAWGSSAVFSVGAVGPTATGGGSGSPDLVFSERFGLYLLSAGRLARAWIDC